MLRSHAATRRNPDELSQVIGQEFFDQAPAEWAEGKITYRQVGRVYKGEAVALGEAGQFVGGRPTRPMLRAFEELRALTARPGKGAWFTAHCTVTPEGKVSLDLDYDTEPDWDPPVDVRHYLEDWEAYPRSAHLTPAWLAERLEQARAEPQN